MEVVTDIILLLAKAIGFIFLGVLVISFIAGITIFLTAVACVVVGMARTALAFVTATFYTQHRKDDVDELMAVADAVAEDPNQWKFWEDDLKGV